MTWQFLGARKSKSNFTMRVPLGEPPSQTPRCKEVEYPLLLHAVQGSNQASNPRLPTAGITEGRAEKG